MGREVDCGDSVRLIDVTEIPSPLPPWATNAAAFIATMYPGMSGFSVVADNNVSGAVRQSDGSYLNPDECVF